MKTGNMMDWSYSPFFHALDLKQAHVRHGKKFNDEVWEWKRMGVGPFFFPFICTPNHVPLKSW